MKTIYPVHGVTLPHLSFHKSKRFRSDKANVAASLVGRRLAVVIVFGAAMALLLLGE